LSGIQLTSLIGDDVFGNKTSDFRLPHGVNEEVDGVAD